MLSLTPFRGQRLRQCVKWLTKWNTSESEQKLHVTIRKLTETNCNYTGNVLSFSPLSSLVSFRGCILNIISLFMSVLLYGHTEEGSRLRIWGDLRSIPQNTYFCDLALNTYSIHWKNLDTKSNQSSIKRKHFQKSDVHLSNLSVIYIHFTLGMKKSWVIVVFLFFWHILWAVWNELIGFTLFLMGNVALDLTLFVSRQTFWNGLIMRFHSISIC